MANMLPSGANGTPNGVHAHGAHGARPDTSRPLSFRDSLPYSPQTTTLPFIPGLPSPFSIDGLLGTILTPLRPNPEPRLGIWLARAQYLGHPPRERTRQPQ